MGKIVNVLGDVVKECRKEQKISQEALAERIGICKRTLIDIEKNTGNPKFELLYLLVRELNLPVDQVFYPDMQENRRTKEKILLELNCCSEHELEVILALVSSLRKVLRSTD